MRSEKRILDLCSGLGGASEAFSAHPSWDVVRVEVNPDLSSVPHTIQRDVLSWMDWVHELPPIHAIWASPPCLEFSNAYDAPKPRALRAGENFEPSLEILTACLEIIAYLRIRDGCDKWIIENVAGAIPHFQEAVGRYRQTVGPFVLWMSRGLPNLILDYSFHHSKAGADTWSTDPLRANKKGKIPIQVSEAYLEALLQPTLEGFS